MKSEWPPHVTVATLVCRTAAQGLEYLFVKEHTEAGVRLNQPAGHWEAGETLLEAAQRETLEETGWEINITGFVSAATYLAPNGVTYLRFTYLAEPLRRRMDAVLDPEIIEPLWLTRAQLEARRPEWRSPLVADVIDQFNSLGSHPLELVTLGR